MRRLLFKSILVILCFPFLSAFAAQSIVKTILTNDRSIRALHEQALPQLPFYTDPNQLSSFKDVRTNTLNSCSMRLNELSPFCSSLKEGCLMVTYLDDPITLFDLKNSSLHAEPDLPGQALVLQDYINAETKFAISTGKGDEHSYKKLFSKAGYGSPLKIKSIDSAAVDQAFIQALKDQNAGSFSENSFVEAVESHPMAFADLPAIYQNATSTGILPAVTEAYSKALFLTLDALTKQADSRSWAYPYDDDLVPESTPLLQIDELYSSLNAIGRWPKISPLDLEARTKFGGIYLKKMKGSWEVLGSYDEKANTIWLDLETPFFENIYVLYHELWHVFWAHSDYNRSSLESISKALQIPESADPDELKKQDEELKSQLLDYISRNELLALDQQIRLYHAVGLITQDWAGLPVTSAMHWHDSYFGEKVEKYLIPKSRMEYFKSAHPSFMRQLTTEFTLGLRTMSEEIQMSQKKPQLDESYWREQIAAHGVNFEEIYLNGAKLELHAEELLHYSKDTHLELSVREPLSLSCKQVLRIARVLGEEWQFGIPLNYTLQDPSDPICKTIPGGPGHGGNEGSHGGLGFPSLEGP